MVIGILAIGLLRESVIKAQTQSDKTQFFHGILSRNSAMKKLFDNIKRAAKSDISIYISGETGVGKELVARAIHAESNRSSQPFVAVNVANFSSDLIESQLFGHKKGAFTGAVNSSAGLMQAAAKGTLFLDEVTSLPVNTQAKLLRVLQERQYYPVGDINLQEFSAIVVSASNLSFEDAVEHHQFRDDLRYRLEVIHLHIPPLRDRRDDILLLFRHFLEQASDVKQWTISPSVESHLIGYDWPGNVRELENCANFTAAMAIEKNLKVSDLPENIQSGLKAQQVKPKPLLDRPLIKKTLALNSGNRTLAAKNLGISRMTLWRKMKLYNLV
ncbi:MAG: sigma-54 dependent transcriptional regulator [Porticoccaceae bacterium]|nr:sigma-54 dependent transcriptional regulator [Porticoccaceae bacterium]